MKVFRKKQKCYLLIWAMAAVMLLGVLGVQKAEQVQAAQNYPYKIKVNKQMCVVTVYEKDAKGAYTVPVKAMLCSPGAETPLGTFRTPVKYRWRLLMGDVWGQYSTRITGGILFHSVWYYKQDPSTLSNAQFNKLGTRCSHGCVRLNVEDAKWIYDNCPIGTEVTIYESSDPGPLGKPEGIKVSQSTLMGYDPTDIWSAGNPYLKTNPAIKGVSNKVIQYGQKVNLMEGVTVLTSTGVSAADKVKISIKHQGKAMKEVTSEKTGLYYITYEITDELGKYAKAEAIYEVVDNVAPEIKGPEGNVYLNKNFDKEAMKDIVKVTWHGKEVEKKNISVTYKELSQKKTIKEYEVTFSYTAPNGKKTETKTKVICDLESPKFTGVKDGVVFKEKELTREFLLSDVTAADNLMGYISSENITVTKVKKNDRKVKIVYEAVDVAGNVGRAKAVYRIMKGIVILGVEDKVIKADQVVDEAFVLEGVKVYKNGADITEQLTVTITSLEGAYKVEYAVSNHSGVTTKKVARYTVEEEPADSEEAATEEKETEGTVTEEVEVGKTETENVETEGMAMEEAETTQTEKTEEADTLEETDSEEVTSEDEKLAV